MKKRFFDPSLYREGLRQTRLMGLVFLIVLELEAILIPLGYFIAMRQDTEPYIRSLSFVEMHPLLLLCFLLLAPLMTLNLFHFLNKRSASDFYHALPNTRTSLFFSFFLAILTWIALVIVLTSLTSLVGFTLLGSRIHVNLTSVLVMVFNMFAASVFVAAAVAVAMFVTGTLFTNVVISLLLIFMPRLLIFVFTSTLTDLLPLLAPGQFLPPLDADYNIVTNSLFQLMTGNESIFTFLPGGIYTLCVGLLYTAGAAALFRARKSEIAGNAATNRGLQTAFRLMIAMLICLIPCVMIVYDVLYRSSFNATDVFLYVVLYLVAILVYFLYELITTRKWRNLVRSLPALGILVVMNVLFLCGLTGAYYSVLSFTPPVEEIASVSLVPDKDPIYGDQSLYAYFTRKTAQVRHTDETIRSVVAERLQYTASYVRQGRWRMYANDQEDAAWQQVAIHQPGRTVYRRILLRERDRAAIARQLGHNESFRQAFLTLPSLGENGTTVSSGWLTGDQARDVYDHMCKELQSADFKDWYLFLKDESRGEEILPPLTLLTDRGTSSDSLTIYVPHFLSETANLYMAYVNANNADSILAMLRDSGGSINDSVNIRTWNMEPQAGGGQTSQYFSGELMRAFADELAAFAQTLDTSTARTPSIDKPLYFLQADHFREVETDDGNLRPSSQTYMAFFQADSPEIPAFLRQLDYTDDAVPKSSQWTQASAD